MRLIATEEHFAVPPRPGEQPPQGLPPLEEKTMVGAPWLSDHSIALDFGEKRLGIMDEWGVERQILSTPFAQGFSAEIAVDKVTFINNYLAERVAEHPDRFSSFAMLPTSVPEACADELVRCVKELGSVGSLIANRVDGDKFLDDPRFDDLLSAHEELDVPLYLHPGQPPQNVIDMCYGGRTMEPRIVSSFSRFGYGWHVDVGIHFLNLVASGVFDRHPKLQVILGHWGELLPYYVDRFDTAMPGDFLGLEHETSYYVRNNAYVTSSGLQDLRCMNLCKDVLGPERLLFSADFPFASFEGTDKLLSNPYFTQEEIELFAYGNAERLMKL